MLRLSVSEDEADPEGDLSCVTLAKQADAVSRCRSHREALQACASRWEIKTPDAQAEGDLNIGLNAASLCMGGGRPTRFGVQRTNPIRFTSRMYGKVSDPVRTLLKAIYNRMTSEKSLRHLQKTRHGAARLAPDPNSALDRQRNPKL